MKLLLTSIVILLLSACANRAGAPIKVASIEDIPSIQEEYAKPLSKLRKGMNKYQVLSLFPNSEQECYESGTCHLTVFDKKEIELNKGLLDLNKLKTTVFSALALTCVLDPDTCTETALAAYNLMAAGTINIGLSKSGVHVPANIIVGSQNPSIPGESFAKSLYDYGSYQFTLLQWINIEINDGVVTEWAINEPLQQYKPNSNTNELPPLEESLGIN